MQTTHRSTAALRGALARTPWVQLHCERLDLIDAWRMSGYGATGAAVEVCA